MFLKPALILSLISLPIAAQDVKSTPASWIHEASDLKPDAAITFGKLENGVRFIILPNAEPPKRVSLRLHIAAGSLMEEDDQQGLAHFLEHMAFNGTKNYAANEMVEFFQRLGMAFGADTNAHTSFDETVYKLELPDHTAELMDKGMLFLRDVADGMIIGAQDVEKERGVILKEKSARDSVSFRMMIEGFKFTLPESLVPNRLPIGTEEVIKTAPQKRFQDFYRRWYTPDRMTVIVTGDIKPEEARKYIDKQFAGLKASVVAATAPDMGKVTTGRGLEAKLLAEKEAGELTISVDASRPSRKLPDNKANRREGITRALADAMLNRRLDILSRKPGAAFIAIQVSHQDWMEFVESSGLEITAKPENWDKALATGEQELRRALEHGFNAAELKEARANLLNSLRDAARQAPGRQSRDLADAISSGLSDKKVFVHPDETLKWAEQVLPAVTLEQCGKALKEGWATEDIRIFAAGNLTLEDGAEKLKQAWTASRAVKVAAPAEEGEATFAYTNFGEPGKIAQTSKVADLGITQVKFANGVRLNLKATDFRKDVIELAANFGDGRMTMPKDKPGLLMFTRMMFDAGGLGKHSVDDLQRVLAGRTVGAGLNINDDTFTLSGTTNRADLLLQCQLMAAALSDPGWRDDSLASVRAELPAFFQRITHTPDGVHKSTVASFLASDDYRFQFPSLEEINARQIIDMRSWLEPQLKSSSLEIGIVGDLDVEATIKAAAATFGALPVRAEAREAHDELRNVKFPAGVAEKEFPFPSQITKSMALVYWPTVDRIKDVGLSRRLSLLAEILSDRLRIKIREELGASYSPDAMSIASDTWPGYGQMIAVMVSDAKDVPKLGTTARELGAALAEKGVTADELERARKPLLTMLEEQRRSNAYWLGTVVTPSQSRPERLDWARTMVDDFKKVSVDDLNKLAAEYLKSDKSMIVRVVSTGADAPEEKKADAPKAPAQEKATPAK